jgi:di/tricarboxylate transporter
MSLDVLIVSVLFVAVFAAFVKEKFSPDLIAMGAVAVLLGCGILSGKEVMALFSNEAAITIACMFVLSAALERTGCLDVLGKGVFTAAGNKPFRALVVIMVMVIPMSAFMNNTPIVVVLTPIVIALARSLGRAPSKYLIPLSFASIFGGTCTLIGTSTNLLVADIAEEQGLAPFGIFDITAPGLILAAAGMLYMLTWGWRQLPDREMIGGAIQSGKKAYIAEILIPEDSKMIGKTITDTALVGEDRTVLDVIRHNVSLRGRLNDIMVQAGDRIVMEANTGEILALHEGGQVKFRAADKYGFEPVQAETTVIVEGIIGPGSNLKGRAVASLNLRRQYGVYLIGVHRQDKDYTERDFATLRLRFGDTLLLQGPAEGMQRLMDSGELISLSHTQEVPVRRGKAPIALGALLAVLLLAAFDVMPISSLSLIAAVGVILTGCLTAEDAYKSIDGRIIFMIFGMLGLSMGMEKAGIISFIVQNSVGWAEAMGPLAVLAIVYFIASWLTEMVSNSAVAVLLSPIAIGLAEHMSVSPYPFLVAIMFGASASFATPIGYQTNTFVYNAGGYKFTDFLKVGGPLNTIMWIVSVAVIPIFFPFNP